MQDKHDLPGYTGLEIIAGFKFLQAATLIVAGLGALGLMHAGIADFAQEWLERLAIGNGQRFAVAAATRVLPWFNAATPRHFAAPSSLSRLRNALISLRTAFSVRPSSLKRSETGWLPRPESSRCLR